MERKPHYLQRVAVGTWPARFLVGHVSLIRKPTAVSSQIAYDEVTDWIVTQCNRNGTSYCIGKRDRGTRADEFWQSIADGLIRKTTVTLYLPKAYRVVTAMGLWDRIEIGEWCVCMAPENDVAENVKGRSRGWNGTVTASGRTTIICVRCVGRAGTLRIVDTGNFAVEVPLTESGTDEGHDRALFWALSWHNMLEMAELGSPQSTVASQAMKAFRSKYIDCPILVHDNAMALLLEREAVHGGRCEAFRIGKVPGEVFHLDASSHYAGVSIESPIPARLSKYYDHWIDNGKPGSRPLERMIAEVSIETPDAFYPVSYGGNVIFPVGSFKTVLCGPELVLANNYGHLVKIHRAAVYEMERPFTRFYKDLWNERTRANRRGNKDLCSSLKAMLSRFHGKFAQRAMQWENVNGAIAPDCFAQWYGPSPDFSTDRYSGLDAEIEPWEIDENGRYKAVAWRSIGYQVQVEVNKGEHRNSCPAISGWILSLGRTRLLEWMLSAGFDNIHYCDTDSIWTNGRGYSLLESGGFVRVDELGYLRLVGRHSSMRIYGLKTYTVDGESTHGGIPDGATVCEDGGNSFYVQPGIESWLKRRETPNSSTFIVRRNGCGPYRHGIPTLGGRVIPFTAPHQLKQRNANSHYVGCQCKRCRAR